MRTIITSRCPVTDRLKSEGGTTLIETLVATLILIVAMAGLLSVGSIATSVTENEGNLGARVTEHAQDKIEQLLALRFADASSDTTVFPVANTGGTGLAIGGSSDPSAPAAGYVDYLNKDGSAACSPCTGLTVPATWSYKRVWQISGPSTNLKQITVTATVALSVGSALRATATVTALKSFPF